MTVGGSAWIHWINRVHRECTRKKIEYFIEFRREVVRRRTEFELRKAEARAHILEGLKIALDHLDAIIKLIKGAHNPPEARSGLIAQFSLTKVQAQAILDLRLHRLTSLEQDKIHSEYQEILDRIRNLLDILSSGDRLTTVIKEELQDIAARYGDDRRTEIIDAQIDLSDEDLIPVEDLVITLSHAEYVKCQPLGDYQAQRRGGRGRVAARTKEDDFIRSMFVANSHDTLLCFSNLGKVYCCLLYTSPSPRDGLLSRMPSSA